MFYSFYYLNVRRVRFVLLLLRTVYNMTYNYTWFVYLSHVYIKPKNHSLLYGHDHLVKLAVISTCKSL